MYDLHWMTLLLEFWWFQGVWDIQISPGIKIVLSLQEEIHQLLVPKDEQKTWVFQFQPYSGLPMHLVWTGAKGWGVDSWWCRRFTKGGQADSDSEKERVCWKARLDASVNPGWQATLYGKGRQWDDKASREHPMVCKRSKESGGTTVYKKRFGNGVTFGSFLPQNPQKNKRTIALCVKWSLVSSKGRAQLQFFWQSCVSGTEQLHTFTPPPKETTTGWRIGPVDYLQRNNHHIGLVAEEAMTMATEELKRKGNKSRKKPAAAEEEEGEVEERRSCCFFKREKQFRKRTRNPLWTVRLSPRENRPQDT